MTLSFRRILLFVLAWATAACASAQPPRYGDPAILFQDDFSQTTSGWDVHTGSEATTNYADEHYLIAVEQPGVDVWARPGLDLADLRLEVDAAHVAGPVDNEYGVLCRYTREGDKSSFYFFFISSDGYYAMGKVVKNQRTILNPTGDWQASTAIRTGPTDVNHLGATCAGSRLSFSVNAISLGEFDDAELTRGDIGLIVGTFDEPGVEIHFDNLVVRRP